MTETLGGSRGSGKVRLPDSTTRLNVHPPSFHVSLLKLTAQDPFSGQVVPHSPPVFVDSEEEYNVEEVLNARTLHQRLKYFI